MAKQKSMGKNIQELRKKMNLTQDELARKAGIPYPTLMKIEQEKVANPTIKTLTKIAKSLGVSVDKLIHSDRSND